MAQVVIIEKDQTILDLLSINLKTFAHADSIPRATTKEAIELLEILPNVDLVICKASLSEGDQGLEIAKFLNDKNSHTPLILWGCKKSPDVYKENIQIVEKEDDWEKVLEKGVFALGVTEESYAKAQTPDYMPISTRYFTTLETSFCDVFIRIKKGAGEFQFVKRVHKGDEFPKELIEKYINQGLKNFYISSEDSKNFTQFISNELVNKLNGKDLDENERIDIMSKAYEIAINEIKTLGFNSSTIQLSEGIVNSMIESYKEGSGLSSLLSKILNSSTGYHYRHAHMCTIICSEILNNLGRDKKELHELMAYASLFKDASLVDYEDYAKITTFEELESLEVSEDIWELIFNHAHDSAQLIRKNPEAPLDVDTIIKHHHGTATGKGFSTQAQTDFPKTSMIFIVAVEFSNELLSFKEKGRRPRPIVDILKEKYDISQMKDIIYALEKTIKKS